MVVTFVLHYLVAAGLFVAIDAIWLTLIAPKFYKAELGSLLLDKPNLLPAVIFYAIFIVGIVIFALMPALEAKSWLVALGLGALFGFIAYATYDLTNLATLKDWSLKVAVVDMIWGAVLTGSVTTLAYLIFNRS